MDGSKVKREERSLLRRSAEWMADLAFPRRCIGCGREGTVLCPSCTDRLHTVAPGCPVCRHRNLTGAVCERCRDRFDVSRFLAPFSYSDALVRELVQAFKYEGVRELAPVLADEITRFLRRYGVALPARAALVPAPLHPRRERRRGYNQSRLLADQLAQRSGLPVIAALRRRRHTAAQISMRSDGERRSNVSGAFELADASAVMDRRIVLVDDVATSGATISEAARALRDAGARTVWAIAIAKG